MSLSPSSKDKTEAPALEIPSYQEGYEFPWIVSIKALEKYRIRLEYSDGVKGEVDLSDCANMSLFAEWQEPGVFGNVCIGEHGEVWWSDMASLCADSLYLNLTGRSFEEVSSS